MEKITIVAKNYDGNEWVKSLAQSGLPQINQQLLNTWGLYTESLLTHGIEMPALPFEAPVGIFIMLRVLRNNRGGYFSNASYKDAEIAYQAIQSLRNQYVGSANQEVEGISSFLLPGILKQKNEAIIHELLVPYLDEIRKLELWDLPSLYHHFIHHARCNGSINNSNKARKGRGVLIEEDPISPLEHAFVSMLYPEDCIEKRSRDSIFPHKPWDTQGKKEIFKAYGSYNEWREVLDRIIQTKQPYDQFLLGSPQEQRIAHFMKEQNFVPFTLASGFQNQCHEIEKALKKRRKQALRAGFLEEELPGLENDIRDSLQNNGVDKSSSQSGKIHLTQVNSLPLIYRKNVYIMGVETYTGGQMENAILLDGDIVGLRSKVAHTNLKTSVEKTRQTIRDFHWTVDLMVRQNRNVTISYSYYDTAQLKIQAKPAALSPYEEIFTNGKDAGYFSPSRISLTKEEANSFVYYSGKLDARQMENSQDKGLGDLEELHVSATRAQTLIQCPYRFALENLLDMGIEDDVKDITRWLDPMQMGSLCHEIFARYHQESENGSSLEEDNALMSAICKQVTDYWLAIMPPSMDPEREIKEIKTLTENYVKLKTQYGKNNCLAVEHAFEAAQLIPGKLSIYGKADLIEESLGKLTIVDVKTGRRVGEMDQDIKSCIQAILYCCLLERENNDAPVKGGYYLYPRTQRIVSCDYNSHVKEKAVDLLKEALTALEVGDSWKTDVKEICGYCPFESICKQEDKRRLFQSLMEEGVFS